MNGAPARVKTTAGAIARGGALAALLLLTACAQTVETRISSTGVAASAPTGYIIVAPDKVTSPAYQTAQSLIMAKLAERGYGPDSAGALYLQLGVASRPASLELRQPDVVVAEASAKRAPLGCLPQEYRLTIALNTIADGTEIYRASASEYHCKQALEAVLPVLIDAALADLKQPKGSYVIKRKLRAP